jgi:hypothetical protein
VGYSGSKSTYLQRAQPLNFMAPGQFTPPTTLAQQQAQQAAGVYTALNSGLSGTVSTQSNRIDPRFKRCPFNPLIESDLTLGRQITLKPERLKLKLQCNSLICLTTRHSAAWARAFRPRPPSATTMAPTQIRGASG